MIKPYYETENGKLYHGDCLEIMREIKDQSIDMILADPPFFNPAVHYQSRISWGRCWGDLSVLGEFFYVVALEYKRILKSSGHLFVFCHDESYPVFFPVAYGKWDFTKALIWDKTRIGLGKIFRHQYEMILWASNKGADVYNDGKVHSDILSHAPSLSKDRLHPVEKPMSLYTELLTICSKENDLIVDTFLGGGTSVATCETSNRRWIGIEISKEYCDIAVERIKREVAQLKLELT